MATLSGLPFEFVDEPGDRPGPRPDSDVVVLDLTEKINIGEPRVWLVETVARPPKLGESITDCMAKPLGIVRARDARIAGVLARIHWRLQVGEFVLVPSPYIGSILAPSFDPLHTPYS